jgi:hypothetical protein
MKHWEQMFAIYVYNHCNIHTKHLQHMKHFKNTLATCDVSRSSLLHRLQWGVATIAGGEAKGLPCQGPMLLLVPAAPVGIVEREHAHDGLGG